MPAQQLNVLAVDPVFDFGYVVEAQGKVYHKFLIENKSPRKVKVREIASSCGCAVGAVSQSTIPPGETIWMEVSYDPTGRPGKFLKSIEVKVTDSLVTQPLFFNIKGVVIDKTIIPTLEQDFSDWKLVIKPFKQTFFNSNDLDFLQSTEMQDFINDLTYEIDKDEFAGVMIEIHTHKTERSPNEYDQMVKDVKQYISSQLLRRNYSENQVGFKVYPPVFSDEAAVKESNIIKISSLKYNRDDVAESYYTLKGKSPLDYYNGLTSYEYLDSTNTLATYEQLNAIDKIQADNSNYGNFIKKLVKQVLMQQGAGISVNVWTTTKAGKTDEKIIEETLKKVAKAQKQIVKSAEEQGIAGEAISFAVPNIQIVSTELPEKIEFRMFTQVEQTGDVSWLGSEEFKEHLMQVAYENISNEKDKENCSQELPVFLQYFQKKKMIDTARLDFRLWMKVMSNEIKKGRKVKILIESSSSNAPTMNKYDNYYVARKRARETKELLIKQLKEYGIKNPEEYLIEAKTLVQGPLYDTRDFLTGFYDKFQYIKLIPVCQDTSKLNLKVPPYQVNFNHNNFQIPSESAVFQLFMDKVEALIRHDGFVELLIESSSSKVPSTVYSSNQVLSFHRADKTREQVRMQLRKRGIDPLRAIFIEDRILVQGPAFRDDFDENSQVYQKYQYIKIISQKELFK